MKRLNPESRPDGDAGMTAVELEELVGKFVDVWASEIQRGGKIRPDTTDIEIRDLKDSVAMTMMGVFKSVDGLLDDLLAGSRTDTIRVISEYLKSIS